MHFSFVLLISLAFVFSCSSTSNKNETKTTLDKTLETQGKTLNELIREEKKKQAELDLPFRGLDPHKDLSVIAFGSCADQDKAQPLWKNITSQNPDLFLFMGDNIYSSKSEQRPIRDQYKKLNKISEYREAREKIPFLVTWDDHDYGQNDGGVDNPDKEEARQEFIRNWTYLKNSLPKEQKAIYHSRTIGKKKNIVQVIMLDTRWDRSPLRKAEEAPSALSDLAMKNTVVPSSDVTVYTLANTPTMAAVATSLDQSLVPPEFLQAPIARIYAADNDKQKRILSENQWRWLEAELRKPASIRLIVSSIQVIANDHNFEKWGNFPHEQERLYQLLKSTRAKNVILLSGDRHMGAIAKTEIKGLGSIYEATASGLNRPARAGNMLLDSSYVKPGFPMENYGLIKLNWADKTYSLELLDLNNSVVSSVSGKF